MASEPYGKVHAFGGERGVGDFERALRDREWARGRKRRGEKRKALLDQWERDVRAEEAKGKKRRVPINMGKAFLH